jgi:dTDP-4-amino-4,6-dideoxygalactose transaminase
MPGIYALSKHYGFKIIEDASHAIGASYVFADPLCEDGAMAPEGISQYESIKVGSCRHSDITVFSFHPVKIITTAEGGMALTNSDALANKLTLLRSHGITRDAAHMTHAPDGPWYYQQIELGYNYRMTELQAALGISQIQRLDTYVARRHQLARRYDRLFRLLPITTPWQNPLSHSSWHLYVIRLQLGSINKTHRQVFEDLRAHGVGVNLHYIPVHLQPYYKRMGFSQGDFPEAERYYSEALSLPLFSTLSESDQDTVNAALCKATSPIASP